MHVGELCCRTNLWKTISTISPSLQVIFQRQFIEVGYLFGHSGEVIVPVALEKDPPQEEFRPEKFDSFWIFNELIVNKDH